MENEPTSLPLPSAPYRGIEPFRFVDQPIFSARPDEVRKLVRLITIYRGIFFYGESGAGKSSLINAGLIPALRKEGFAPERVRVQPIAEQELVIERIALTNEGTPPFLPSRFAASADNKTPEPARLVLSVEEFVRCIGKAPLPQKQGGIAMSGAVPVLFFDQFEELVTLFEEAPDSREKFNQAREIQSRIVEMLLGFLGDPNLSVKLVLSFREDYLAKVSRRLAAAPELGEQAFRLSSLPDTELQKIIRGPFESKLIPAGHFTRRLSESAFEALESSFKELSDTGTINLTEVQIACLALWENEEEEKAFLKETDHREAVRRLFGNYLDRALNGLDQKFRKPAITALTFLVTSSGTRNIVSEDDLLGNVVRDDQLTQSDARQVLNALSGTTRLVLRQTRGDSAFYEISSEFLIPWIAEKRQARERDAQLEKEREEHERQQRELTQTQALLSEQRKRADDQAKAAKLQRRLTWAMVLLSVVALVAAGLSWFQKKAAKAAKEFAIQQRKIAQKETARAEAERQNAEQLLGFLLGEGFLGEIRDIGRSTMLEKVRERVLATEQSSMLNKGLTQRNAGDIARARGEIQKSVKLFGQALMFIESSPDSPDKPREIARTHDRMGDALDDRGEIAQALTHYEAEVEAWRQLVSGDSLAPAHATDDCVRLADSLVSAGDLKRRMGDADGALKYMQESIEIVSAVLFGRKTPHVQCGPAANEIEPHLNPEALEVLSRAVSLRVSVLSSQEDDCDLTAALALEARRLQPFSMELRRQALVSLTVRANGRGAPTSGEALRDYQKALTEFDELLRWDPANKLWQREQAVCQVLVASGMVACVKSKSADCKPMPSLEDAEGMSLEAIETLRTLARSDPSNVSWKSDIAAALQEHAKVLTELGQKRQRERLEDIEESERIYDDLERDSAYAERIENVASLLEDKAEALAALGDRDQAEATWQRAFERFKKLIEKHPDMPIYVFDLSDAFSREATVLRNYGDRVSANAAKTAEKEKEKLEQKYLTNEKQRDEEAVSLVGSEKKHVMEGDKLYKEERYGEALSEFSSTEMDALKYMRLRSTTSVDYDNLRSIYARIANTHEKLGDGKQQIAALRAAMYAATIAALLEPADKDTINKLETTRRELAQLLRKDGRLGEAMIMVREEVVAAADLVSRNKLDASYLWTLGDAKCGRGRVRRENKQEGWKESIRNGLIQLQKAAAIDKKNSAYAEEVGDWRKYLADELESDGNKNEAMEERRLALEAYRNAARRAPDDEEIKNAIRDLAKQGVR